MRHITEGTSWRRSGRSIAEHGPSGKKFTLVVGDKEYPRRVAALVMGGVLLVMGGFFAGVLWLIHGGSRRTRGVPTRRPGWRN